jgi:hypothetical protein
LLVGEIALACTLLVGATLLVRSFINLANAEFFGTALSSA